MGESGSKKKSDSLGKVREKSLEEVMKKDKKKVDERVEILRVGVSGASEIQVLENLGRILGLKRKKRPILVVTPNSEQVVQAQQDDVFRSILNKSDLALPDGVGIVLASRLLKIAGFKEKSIKKRVSGVDVMEKLCKVVSEKGLKVFLLGGKGGVAELAAQRLKKRYSGLQVKAFAGSQAVEKETREELGESLARVNGFNTDVLFVGFGAPMQEKWVWENLDKLRVKVVMVVGGSFDVIAGNVRRAPKWMRAVGLEWLWRLTQEPWRWRRQLRLLKFWRLVLKELVG